MLSSLYILQANATARLCWLMGAWISKSRFSSCTACEHLPGTTVPPCPLPGFKLPPCTMCKFWPVAAAGITLHRMSLFSWGPAHAACFLWWALASSCLWLHPSASFWIALHLSASLCVPLCPPAHLGGQSKVSDQRAGSHSTCSSHWEAVKSEGARLAPSDQGLCSLCLLTGHSCCVP